LGNTVDILTILTNVAPLVLSTIVLSAVLLFVMWAAIKIVIPAMREQVQLSEAQRSSWESIISEQKRLNSSLVGELRHDLEEERAARKALAVRVEELSTEVARKDARIAELQVELDNLRRVVLQKDSLVADLRRELDEMKRSRAELATERDALSKRIAVLENQTPATSAS
jgi:chromosome segregation ATPase